MVANFHFSLNYSFKVCVSWVCFLSQLCWFRYAFYPRPHLTAFVYCLFYYGLHGTKPDFSSFSHLICSPFEPSGFADIRILCFYSCIPVCYASYLYNRAVILTYIHKCEILAHALCIKFSLQIWALCFYILDITAHWMQRMPISRFTFIVVNAPEYCITQYSLAENKRQFICCIIWWCYSSYSHINNNQFALTNLILFSTWSVLGSKK